MKESTFSHNGAVFNNGSPVVMNFVGYGFTVRTDTVFNALHEVNYWFSLMYNRYL